MTPTLAELFVPYVAPLVSVVVAAAFDIFGKPRTREKEIGRERLELLERLEYDLARDVANVVPSRGEAVAITDEEYLETCKARLRDRVPRGLGSTSFDYCDSEHCFHCFVCCVRLFTYVGGAVGASELALFAGGVTGMLVLPRTTITVLAFVGFFVAIVLIALVSAMGDRYQNYLNKYKICDTGSQDGKK